MTGGRRVFLRRAAGLGLAALSAHRIPAVAAAAKPLMLSPLAPGIYASAVERHDLPLSPSVVAIGPDGVLVVDPGPNLNHGRRLIAAIRRLTALPVRWVVNSHPHPWQVLANAAFAELRPRAAFLASTATADAMRSRCDVCRRLLVSELGAAAMADTDIVLPRPALQHGAVLDAAGFRWQVRIFAGAHSASDTVLYAPALQLLCGGGLVTGDHVPDLRDGSLTGWRAALRALAALPATVVVGSVVGAPQRSLAPTLAYLDSLDDAIRQALARGVDAADATRAVPGHAFRRWRGFVPRHALNVQRAWLELEDQWMLTAPARPS